ncbi:transposase [Nocardia sp. NBC_00508]|uniref:transposase n=1 Tax=Nocardia sp. NBC_00508 TaxID=2975992 RepID=UPI003FA59D9B
MVRWGQEGAPRGSTEGVSGRVRGSSGPLVSGVGPETDDRKLAQQLGVHYEALRNWIRQADTSRRPEPAATDLAEENKRLHQQVAGGCYTIG